MDLALHWLCAHKTHKSCFISERIRPQHTEPVSKILQNQTQLPHRSAEVIAVSGAGELRCPARKKGRGRSDRTTWRDFR